MPISRHKAKVQKPISEPTPYDSLLCFNFYVGWRAIQEFYAPAFPHELNPQRMYVLGMCQGDGASVRQIAAAMRIDDAAVSNLLNRLERDGLVRRSRDPCDARGVISVITPKGERLVAATDRRLQALDHELARFVSKADAAAVARAVKGLLRSKSAARPTAQINRADR